MSLYSFLNVARCRQVLKLLSVFTSVSSSYAPHLPGGEVIKVPVFCRPLYYSPILSIKMWDIIKVWCGLPFASSLQLDGYSHKIRKTLHSNLIRKEWWLKRRYRLPST